MGRGVLRVVCLEGIHVGIPSRALTHRHHHCITPLQNTHQQHKAKAAMGKRLEQDRLLYGALSEGKEKGWEDLAKGYERLLGAMQVRGREAGLVCVWEGGIGHHVTIS